MTTLNQNQQGGHVMICVLLLIVVAATSSLEEATASTPTKSLESAPTTRSTFRTDITRVEPAGVGRNNSSRIAYHVQVSASRAKSLGDSVQANQAQSTNAPDNWVSRVKAVPAAYSMSLVLGTPPQTFTVLVDTGSDLTWVQGQGCTQCTDQPDALYDSTTSSSYVPLACSSTMCLNLEHQGSCRDPNSDCQYTYRYGDRSFTSGSFSTEAISLTSGNGVLQKIPGFAFGVGFQNSDDFTGVDGLIGLGQGPISFPSQLGADYGRVFSYCLVTWSDSPSQTSPIIFGSGAVPPGNVQYTPLVTNAKINNSNTFWFITLKGVSVTGKGNGTQSQAFDATSEPIYTIIDTGTTVTMLASSTYSAVTVALATEIKYPEGSGGNTGLDFCFQIPLDSTPTFPGLTFHFDGADWVVPHENLFLPVDDLGNWCLLMQVTTTQGVQIFGNTQQQNFRVVYDQPNKQLGWIATKCDAMSSSAPSRVNLHGVIFFLAAVILLWLNPL